MKRNFIFIFIIFATACFIITGCSCTKKDNGEANQSVKTLKFYVPSNFKSRNDLRGTLYNDDSRKIFAKGDVDDYSTFMYVDVIRQVNETPLKDYIDNVNTNNLNENDIKFEKKEECSLEVYGREEYETTKGDTKIVNYAYLTVIDKDYYTITISGSDNAKDEVKDIANRVLNSLQKQTS